MYIIGLTGGIASGKSTAGRVLRSLGAFVVEADAIARDLTAPEGRAAGAVMARFGTLDRRALGRIVFADEAARRELNGIVHPLVQAEMEATLRASGAPVAVVDVPLLFEAGMEHMADEVWVVYVPREEQIRRVMERGFSREEAIMRIESQMPTEEKIRRADVAIDTSGPLEETGQRIKSLWQEAQKRARVTG